MLLVSSGCLEAWLRVVNRDSGGKDRYAEEICRMEEMGGYPGQTCSATFIELFR